MDSKEKTNMITSSSNSPIKTIIIFNTLFLLIDIIFSIFVGFILFFLNIRYNLYYGEALFGISFLISFIYVLINNKKLSEKESDPFAFWLLMFIMYIGISALFIGIVLLINNVKVIYGFDLIFLGVFCIISAIFLIVKRKNLKREGIMYLYRTKVGIKLINYVGGKFKKTLKVLSYFSVICGYILMASMAYFLIKLIYIYLFEPRIVQAIKIPPLMPLVPYVPELFKISFLPPFYFTYWIIAIAVIAIFHEFSHGIFAKRYGVKIKTTGFGFLGPFLAAFVEPSEKQMQKKPKLQQITILSAGTFANVILTAVFFVLLMGFFNAAYAPSGALFDDYAKGVVKVSDISYVGGVVVTNATSEQIITLINNNRIYDNIATGSGKDQMNLTEVRSNKTIFFVKVNDLKNQLEQKPSYVVMYYNFPALKEMLKGVIIKVNEHKINSINDLNTALGNYKPGDNVIIETKSPDGNSVYNISLVENPNEKGRAMIGIATSKTQGKGIMSSIYSAFNLFRQPGTYYEPKWNPDLTIFIYNLIWWLVLINFSVALINMWPVAIFDGGRVFMLSVWAVTRSEKFAKIAFKAMTYAIIIAILLLMYGWAIAVF